MARTSKAEVSITEAANDHLLPAVIWRMRLTITRRIIAPLKETTRSPAITGDSAHPPPTAPTMTTTTLSTNPWRPSVLRMRFASQPTAPPTTSQVNTFICCSSILVLRAASSNAAFNNQLSEPCEIAHDARSPTKSVAECSGGGHGLHKNRYDRR